MVNSELKICTRGIWDSTIPGITFDENGVSNYAKMFDRLCETFPRGERGKRQWERILNGIKTSAKGKRYDCIIGVSGGTDSSFLLHIAKKEFGLNPLAVNLDNGWNSDIAVRNIKKVTQALDIDLETYVIDYEEVVRVLRAYMKSGLPWIDGPTDNAIAAVLYKTAARERIKFVLNGSDFRSEGKQPSEWTYTDSRQMMHIVNKFEKGRLKSYPYQTLSNLFMDTIYRQIKSYRPFYYIDYQKKTAQKILINEYGWEYYGGHHHENSFTKFAIAYWMPKNSDLTREKITLSAQVLSGEITRNSAIELISKPPYDVEDMERDKDFVLKKLEISKSDFESIWSTTNKTFYDYPSYYWFLTRFKNLSQKLMKFVYPESPTIYIEKESR